VDDRFARSACPPDALIDIGREICVKPERHPASCRHVLKDGRVISGLYILQDQCPMLEVRVGQ
jgi:hypothetical protein